MIQLFDIKKNNKKLKKEDTELFKKYYKESTKSKEEVFVEFNTGDCGIRDCLCVECRAAF